MKKDEKADPVDAKFEVHYYEKKNNEEADTDQKDESDDIEFHTKKLPDPSNASGKPKNPPVEKDDTNYWGAK